MMLVCPHCDIAQDAITNLDDPNAQPGKGDVCVCSYCLNVGVFTGTGYELRKPTQAEVLGIFKNKSTQNHKFVAQALKESRGKRLN